MKFYRLPNGLIINLEYVKLVRVSAPKDRSGIPTAIVEIALEGIKAIAVTENVEQVLEDMTAFCTNVDASFVP